jgi:hypothetical protein
MPVIDEEDARLAKAVWKIKQAAAGRVCGDCAHYRGNWCAEKTSIEGHELEIDYPSAIACSEWSGR